MLTSLQKSFLEARVVLPRPADFDEDVIIVSVGNEKSLFSHRHVRAAGKSHHFVFVKEESTGWVCADIKLQEWIERYNADAEKLLQHFA
ncbi:hypothetical protein [Mucilaginibacter celer]|uniref:Uncharacterized protein n=1 Tax=Mucilaginibacter celer TaxID=2305508 RepID=A0A494W6G3_9SPHI|nr:hypothetical protein [Mucilaginibacter celer]AYL99138.1 hypothetical protein HYN43_029415 [Mucilaginibacter celer]